MAKLMLVNPRKRRRKRRKTRKTVARRRPAARRRRRSVKRRSVRRRRNPVTARGIVQSQLLPAATNAMGALSLDILWSYVPVPMNIKTGPFKHIAKGIGAIGIGMLAGNIINKRTARAMSQGALTVVMHDAMREVTQQMMPGVPLSYYSPGLPSGGSGFNEYTNGSGLGAYVEGGSNASPYLAADTLAKPFAGPSAATVAAETCLERESNMGRYY